MRQGSWGCINSVFGVGSLHGNIMKEALGGKKQKHDDDLSLPRRSRGEAGGGGGGGGNGRCG